MQICKELPGNQHMLVFHFVKVDNSLTGTPSRRSTECHASLQPHANNTHGKVTPISKRLAAASWRRWFQYDVWLSLQIHSHTIRRSAACWKPSVTGEIIWMTVWPRNKTTVFPLRRTPVCLLPVTNRHTDRHFSLLLQQHLTFMELNQKHCRLSTSAHTSFKICISLLIDCFIYAVLFKSLNMAN